MTTETELIRVYFPGVTSSDPLNTIGRASYSNTIVQDVIDEGLLYTETDFMGNEVVCMVTVYGKTTLTINIGANQTISPEPLEPNWVIRGRPDDRGKGR